MRRLFRALTEAQGDDEFVAASSKIDLGTKCDIAAARRIVKPGQLEMLRQILPTIRAADEADRAGAPRHRASERESIAAAAREQHVVPFIGAEPGVVIGAAIDEMRRQQREQAIVARTVERVEDDTLQHDVAVRVRNDRLRDPIAAIGSDVA